jgi:hypothetical protein
LKKYLLSILLVISFIANIVFLFTILKTPTHHNPPDIQKEDMVDSVIYAADILRQDGWENPMGLPVSEFAYSYSVNQGCYIDVSVVPENTVFMEQKYDITTKKVFVNWAKNLLLTKTEYSRLPSLNHVYLVFSYIQEHLYSDWFQNGRTYLISYKETVDAEQIPADPASRNYQVYILGKTGATEVTLAQDVTGEQYYRFEIIVNNVVRMVYVDTNRLNDIQ